MGADLLPPERYLRGGARPPVLQASWGMSICLSSDKGISPEIREVKMFSMVTWGLGLLLRKLQGTLGAERKDGSVQSPGHREGKRTGAHSIQVTMGAWSPVELCGFWFLYR